MKAPIKIKSSSNGLRIIMNPEETYETLVEELRQKLTDTRKFFGSAKMVLSFEGKDLTEEEQDAFCDIIKECTDIDIVCIADLPETEESFHHCIRVVSEEYKRNSVCFINHSIINQDFVDSDENVIIIGDVHPGCTVMSAKSIYIFGGLYGEAYAGVRKTAAETNTTDTADMTLTILAMEMAPEELRIGSYCYQPVKKPKWGIKPKISPQIAYVSNDKINIEPYTKELLKRIMDQ